MMMKYKLNIALNYYL